MLGEPVHTGVVFPCGFDTAPPLHFSFLNSTFNLTLDLKINHEALKMNRLHTYIVLNCLWL